MQSRTARECSQARGRATLPRELTDLTLVPAMARLVLQSFMRTRMIAALIGAAAAAAFAWASAASLQISPESPELPSDASPLSSADETSPVPFWWLLDPDSEPGGYRLLLQGGTIHAVADQVRLLEPQGRIIAQVDTGPVMGSVNSCMGGRGLLRTEIPLVEETGSLFVTGWPGGYRVEARVAGAWRATELALVDCPPSEAAPLQ